MSERLRERLRALARDMGHVQELSKRGQQSADDHAMRARLELWRTELFSLEAALSGSPGDESTRKTERNDQDTRGADSQYRDQSGTAMDTMGMGRKIKTTQQKEDADGNETTAQGVKREPPRAGCAQAAAKEDAAVAEASGSASLRTAHRNARKAVRGALLSALDAHGPITLEFVDSAVKRVLGVLALSPVAGEAQGAAAVPTVSERVFYDELLSVARSLDIIAEHVGQQSYLNALFECGVLRSAVTIVESCIDHDYPGYKAEIERRCDARLRRALAGLPSAGESSGGDAGRLSPERRAESSLTATVSAPENREVCVPGSHFFWVGNDICQCGAIDRAPDRSPGTSRQDQT